MRTKCDCSPTATAAIAVACETQSATIESARSGSTLDTDAYWGPNSRVTVAVGMTMAITATGITTDTTAVNMFPYSSWNRSFADSAKARAIMGSTGVVMITGRYREYSGNCATAP